MKLRVRSAAGGPTYRIQVPLPETLQDLKEAISATASLPLASLELSLNKKDAIEGPGTTPLTALDVRGGDLVFFSDGTVWGMSGSPAQQLAQGHENRVSRTPELLSNDPELGQRPECTGRHAGRVPGLSTQENMSPATRDNPTSMRALCAAAADLRATTSRKPAVETGAVFPEAAETPDKGKLPMAKLEGEDMDLEIPEMSSLGGAEENLLYEKDGPLTSQRGDEKDFPSIPALLHRVFLIEADNVTERPAYLVLAAHAVMLETGFVRVESSNRTGSSSEETPLLSAWARNGGIVNMEYSLPELLEARVANSTTKTVGDVLLRCQIVGNAFIAYGTVAGGGGSQVYRLSLPISKFLCQPSKSGSDLLEKVRRGEQETEDGQNVERDRRDITSSIFPNVFELWKEVKDRLSLPLLTDLCGKAGLPPPPSLLLLPTELKVKILEPLPAASLAAVACVCSELKFLSSSDELWKEKFQSEFRLADLGDRAPGGRGWKAAFGREWVRRKRRQEDRRMAERHCCAESFPTLVLRPSVPPTFGGDYDRFPGFPGGPAFPGRLGPTPGARYRRGIFPAPAVGSTRGGALGTRLGTDMWRDFGLFGMRGDDIGDDLERY